jgi:hypothetical protein
MPTAILTIRTPGKPDSEIELSGGASIGRAGDNSVCIDDQSISRYHAIIEVRGAGFAITDLGSVNGTLVNGEKICGEQQLFDGDAISFGGIATVEFQSADSKRPADAAAPPTQSAVPPAKQEGSSPEAAGGSRKLLAAAAGFGLVLTALIALWASGVLSGSSGVKARIASPSQGATIRGPLNVRLQIDAPSSVARVTLRLNGIDVAQSERAPFDLAVDPAQLAARFPSLSNGTHILSVVIEDKDGEKSEPESVVLAFDMPASEVTSGSGGPVPDSNGSDAGLPPTGAIDVGALSQALASQLSGRSGFVFAPPFAELVRLRTADYRIDIGEDARRHRRDICRAFANQGLPPLVGFVLAMSQSRFRGGASPDGAGLWRVPPSIAVEQGYLAPGETEQALLDPRRSADVAAAYLKQLDGLFGREYFMYAIACYGMPLGQAGEIRTRLEQTSDPALRRDFWRMVESGVIPREAADRVVRFFAAGIVGENPQLFGLRPDRLSSLC